MGRRLRKGYGDGSMSSKAAKRRQSLAARDKRRKIAEALKQDWVCVCGTKVPGGFPICLCTRLRPEPKV